MSIEHPNQRRRGQAFPVLQMVSSPRSGPVRPALQSPRDRRPRRQGQPFGTDVPSGPITALSGLKLPRSRSEWKNDSQMPDSPRKPDSQGLRICTRAVWVLGALYPWSVRSHSGLRLNVFWNRWLPTVSLDPLGKTRATMRKEKALDPSIERGSMGVTPSQRGFSMVLLIFTLHYLVSEVFQYTPKRCCWCFMLTRVTPASGPRGFVMWAQM